MQLIVNECVGMRENKIEDQIQIFPNPSAGIFYLEISMNGSKQIEVLNAAGQPVGSLSTMGPEATIDLSSYANGIYTLKIQLGNSVLYRKILHQ